MKYQKINSGHSTDTYLIPNHPKFKCDVAQKRFNDSMHSAARWRTEFRFVRDVIIPLLFKKEYSPYRIPKILQIEPNVVLEQFMPGKRLTKEVYRNLTNGDQGIVIYAIAHLLNDLHNEIPAISMAEYFERKSSAHNQYNFSVALRNMTGFLNNKEIAEISAAKNKFLKNPETRKPCLQMIHGDFKPSNILWDQETKTLSGLDFGECQFALLPNTGISDFTVTGYGAFNAMDEESRLRVLNVYNSLKKQKLENIDTDVVDKFDNDWMILNDIMNEFLSFPKNGNNSIELFQNSPAGTKLGQFSREVMWNATPYYRNLINNAMNKIL